MNAVWPLGTQPDEALLCPVPAIHLVDAEEIAAREGYVAFGTSAAELFLDLRAKGLMGQIQVFIFPTFTGAEHAKDQPAVTRLLTPQRARFAGRLRSLCDPASKTPRKRVHPIPAVRPSSTTSGSQPDGDWDLFWEVEAITPCDVELSSFARHGTRAKFAKGFKLHGPILARTVP